MVEVRYNTKHPAGATAEQRIQNRLRSSGQAGFGRAEDHAVTQPTRTHHHIHHGGSQHRQHGKEENEHE
jgi:hypothetical protein